MQQQALNIKRVDIEDLDEYSDCGEDANEFSPTQSPRMVGNIVKPSPIEAKLLFRTSIDNFTTEARSLAHKNYPFSLFQEELVACSNSNI